MSTVERVDAISGGGSYAILVGGGLLKRLSELLPSPVLAVVTDVTVGPLYAQSAAERLSVSPPVELPAGESAKTIDHVTRVIRELLDRGLTRRDGLAAIGGGVVTDTAGFAASVFLRGIEWVAVPTTLLAMVDAAVGGKTGVNMGEGKNLIGTFWPPKLVVADVDTLRTLEVRQLRAGLAEVVKTAWIGDRGLLDMVCRPIERFDDVDHCRWEELVVRAVRVKADIVCADEREAGPRQVLNLGHTLGHAVEAATGYDRFLHGEAVALGLIGAAWLARRRGMLSRESRDELVGVVRRLGPWPVPPEDEEVLRHVGFDKKRGKGGVSWVLPTDDGAVVDQSVPVEEIRGALAEMRRAAREDVR